MAKEELIRKRLKELAGEVGPPSTLLATVKSINESELTCVLKDDDGLEFFDVRLTPVIDGNESVTIIPKVDTWVLAVRIEDSNDWLVIAVGEAAKVHVKCEAVVFNDGNNGGIVKWASAKAQHDLVKNFIQAVKNVASTPVAEPGLGAPSAFQAALNAAIATINAPSFEDLENTKVKH